MRMRGSADPRQSSIVRTFCAAIAGDEGGTAPLRFFTSIQTRQGLPALGLQLAARWAKQWCDIAPNGGFVRSSVVGRDVAGCREWTSWFTSGPMLATRHSRN